MSASSVEGSPFESPSHSPSLGPQQHCRLSARRGSVSASDPWGAHASVNLNPSRSTSSRLTIVRVPPQSELEDGSRRHRRHGSNASLSSTSSKGESGRLSFAFTSFGPSSAGSTGRSSPPSPRIRPSSPGGGLSQRQSLSLPQHTRLSPEQLVDLARQSCNPRPNVPSSATPTAHVSFTPLPDDIYLPFIDRPTEVTSLISTLPTAKLFALLAQTFHTNARTPSSGSDKSGTPSVDSDPKTWSYSELENWLKNVDRDVADDVLWVRKARECVLAHSELIWERIKGALGVPPELNVDDDDLPFHLHQYRSSSSRTSSSSREAAAQQRIQSALDAPVFEPDSPVSPFLTVDPPEAQSDAFILTEDLISVEPIVASPLPPPSASHVDQGQGTSLHELREEDEEEAENEFANPSSSMLEEPEIQGLRFSTSPSAPLLSASVGPIVSKTSIGGAVAAGGGVSAGSSVAGGSSVGSNSPLMRFRAMQLHDDGSEDGMYDPSRERGPGRPLFPSSFAHLATGPTLRGSERAQSMSYPNPSAYALRRASIGSRPLGASGIGPSLSNTGAGTGIGTPPVIIPGGGGGRRPVITSEWDLDIRHEYAVSASSMSGME